MSIHPALVAPFLGKPLVALDLDFRNEDYVRNGIIVPTLAGLGGLTHTQSGACYELDASGALVAFSANQPRVVPGLGLWARSGFTNLFRSSAALDNATWQKQVSATVNANTATDPLGGSTGDTLNFAANSVSGVYDSNYASATAAGTYTEGVWAKAASAGLTFNLGSYNSTDGQRTTTKAAGLAWQRFSATYVNAAASAHYLLNPTATVRSLDFWGMTLYTGPQIGPYIATTGATASNGAAVLTIPHKVSAADFVFLVAFNLAEGSTGVAGRTLAALTTASAQDRIQLRIGTSDGIDAIVRSGNVNQSIGSLATAPITTGRGVAAIRYRGGKFTLARKINAAAAVIGAEGTAATFPVDLARVDVGHLVSGQQADCVIERVQMLRGTFDDTAFGNLITAIAA